MRDLMTRLRNGARNGEVRFVFAVVVGVLVAGFVVRHTIG